MTARPKQDFFLFLIGGAFFAAGIFLFTNQVMVGSALRFSGGGFAGRTFGGGFGGGFSGVVAQGVGEGFGLLVLLLGIGVCLLFSGTYRRAGWFLVWASSAAVGVGVLHSLFISFRPTTLWSLATMVVMIAAGGGLMFRSLSSYAGEGHHRRPDADGLGASGDSSSSADDLAAAERELERLRRELERSANR
ncbi:hypothetical protein KBY97_01290 [Synechococcus sp. ATX 2A4]|uniref:hypothetical protein n=1 Tax=Synechococcus sp. ATX 2A4 TaxID=2823727 RepID=UPI0020CD8B42|nr:hypothetical protein [Synechococcus sp. ATX 2A4]MCP9883763.1 hypothetical protein [Synechococcus sp. ATX 2A4]